MKIIRSINKIRSEIRRSKKKGRSVGLVPTMGFLHEGHASLVKRARQENDVVVVSIFVNPAQFGPNEDLDAYPRDFARDEKLCREAGADFLFYPNSENMYLDDHSLWLSEESLSTVLCGASRPGHFRGVCTIVAKLLNIVQPDFMVLGEKAEQARRTPNASRDPARCGTPATSIISKRAAARTTPASVRWCASVRKTACSDTHASPA